MSGGVDNLRDNLRKLRLGRQKMNDLKLDEFGFPILPGGVMTIWSTWKRFPGEFKLSVKGLITEQVKLPSGESRDFEDILLHNPNLDVCVTREKGKSTRQVTVKASDLVSVVTGKLIPLDDITFAELLRKRSRGAPRIRHPEQWRLCFQLDEPASLPNRSNQSKHGSAAKRRDRQVSPEEAWRVRRFLQAVDDPSLLLDPEALWEPSAYGPEIIQRINREEITEYLERSFDLVVTVFPPLGEGPSLDTQNAIKFIVEVAQQLEEIGFTVRLPDWCMRRKKSSPLFTYRAIVRNTSGVGTGDLSQNSLLDFDWQVALGDDSLTEKELQAIAALKIPIFQLRGRWIQLGEIDLQAIKDYLAGRWKRQGNLQDLFRFFLACHEPSSGVKAAVTAPAQVDRLIDQLTAHAKFEELESPLGLRGTLRPYQQRGFSWMAFLCKLGFGACLADDMGLGKTIQTLAFLLKNWETDKRPTLLISPVSVIPNWEKEIRVFAPSLRFLRHHSGDRLVSATKFQKAIAGKAIVISSYGLLVHDTELFQSVSWAGVILDEAQNTKNYDTLQARSARALNGDFRIALTGTPIENHVDDLWSIMEFLNPGFLGSHSEFGRRFLIPIQKRGDTKSGESLKRITAPFVLRRMKSDKDIAPDLPEKKESSVFCSLTREQATLYKAALQDSFGVIEGKSGIARKGSILSLLQTLKQICNHPVNFLLDNSPIAGRSGKLSRLSEMLEEILDVGERALVFTQFKAMGDIIESHLRSTFGIETLFLHGKIPVRARGKMISEFQEREKGPPVFILTLKVGGTGLNLTRATHVFHFDRWWNPATENQATDRVYRIGQRRDVQIHKLVCAGTLEEKINAMLESKSKVASRIIKTGEDALTELSTNELKEVLRLRDNAVAD